MNPTQETQSSPPVESNSLTPQSKITNPSKFGRFRGWLKGWAHKRSTAPERVKSYLPNETMSTVEQKSDNPPNGESSNQINESMHYSRVGLLEHRISDMQAQLNKIIEEKGWGKTDNMTPDERGQLGPLVGEIDRLKKELENAKANEASYQLGKTKLQRDAAVKAELGNYTREVEGAAPSDSAQVEKVTNSAD